MKRKGISKEKLKKVKALDLLTYYMNYEPTELFSYSEDDYGTKTYSSLHMSNGLWSYWKKEIGGKSALDFFIKVKGYDFLEAAHYLYDLIEKNPPNKIIQIRKQSREFRLPKRNMDDTKIKDYLVNERKIDKDIVQYCIDHGLIYESKYDHAVVFVGYDLKKIPKHACTRSIKGMEKKDVSGSSKAYSFSIRNPQSRTVHVFESAIDLLSMMTLLKRSGRDYLKDNYLSLSGASMMGKSIDKTSIPIALDTFIKDEFINTIYLHLDNDDVGRATSQKIIHYLKDKYTIYDVPPRIGKDFNEMLINKSKKIKTMNR